MNKDELLDILNTFIKDNNKSMLINGRWGCGLAYLINEFMNTNNKLFKRPRLYYLSAFGFKTIDELHTKVYSIIHPSSKFIKFGKILNCATPLLPHANSLTKEALVRTFDTYEQDTKNTNKVFTKHKKSKRKLNILTIDDFGRTKIYYERLLLG